MASRHVTSSLHDVSLQGGYERRILKYMNGSDREMMTSHDVGDRIHKSALESTCGIAEIQEET
jgi:hypothetical protein